YGDDIILNYTLSLRNPTYYDSDILNQIEDIKLYINGVENVTTKYENYTLSSLDIGSYEVYYTTCKRESNKVTFSVLLYSQISADKESYDYYDGITNNITLAITDEDGEKGTIDVYVKGGEYTKVLTYYNVKDKYKISTEALKNALENIYTDLDSSYTINITYNSNSDIVNPSSTEFTLNIIKQRNTSIIYDILNNTEGNVQINITVIDTVYNTAVPDSQIEVAGNITKTTTSGVLTDNTLTSGDYTINVKYSQTDEYAESDVTIDFTVEIDKDAKIAELEDNITELTNQLEELNNKTNNLTSQLEDAKTQITTLNDTVNDLTQDLKNANNTIKELNNTLNNLIKENKKLNDTINNLTNQNKQLEAKNKNLTDTIIQLENNIKTLENTISQLESIIEELNKTPTKNATTVTISEVTGQVGTVTKLKATVKDSNGKAVKDGNVLFKVNGITLKDADGNILYGAVDNGVATINYTIPKSWYKNTTTVEAVYVGNSIYLSSRANNSKNSISQGNVNIKLDDLSSYENGDAIKFVVTVTDKEKNPITGGTVIIKANGVTLKDSSGNPLQANVVNGLAVLDYNITLSAKVYNITAVYSYTGYNRIEATAKLNVTKAMTFVKYDPVKTNTTKTRITANIINRYETGINTTVGIKIDGKLVNTTKSVNGLVNISVPTNITAGIHAIEFTVGESGCYKSNRLTSVIIKK
ncbi:MAG: hypothetical protein Q4Q22_06890, partial [Methanosphaera sp.]|nr:hypothetical protein [Methanosphaera sp.]